MQIARRNWMIDGSIILAAFAVQSIEFATNGVAQYAHQIWWIAARTLLLVGMRRYPLATLALVGTVGNIAATHGWFESTVDYVFNIALFSAALRVPASRRLAIIAVWCGVDVWYTVAMWTDGTTFGDIVAYVTEEAMAFAAGRWIATSDALLREIAASRDAQATTDIANERASIAREIHDIVGHYLATIVLHAGAGRLRLATDDDQTAARDAFLAIEEAGRQAMTETQSALGVLRDRPAPAYGLASVQRLIADGRRAGLNITFEVDTPSVGAALIDGRIDATAYRIIQESLTNATKYGTGSVELMISSSAQTLNILVSNPLLPRRHGILDVGSSGHGIEGMRQRVCDRGGSLNVHIANNVFVLRAQIPSAL